MAVDDSIDDVAERASYNQREPDRCQTASLVRSRPENQHDKRHDNNRGQQNAAVNSGKETERNTGIVRQVKR